MATDTKGVPKSFLAGESLATARVVYLSAAKTVKYWATETSNILGVTCDDAASGGAIPVVTGVGEIVKVKISGSVTAGDLLGPVTDGSGVVATVAQSATITASVPIAGVALTGGTTTEVIEMLLQPSNPIIR